MCGIVIRFDATGISESLCAQMLKDLHHRGPDASGSILRDSHKLYMGHARLKIIDISDVANQPLLSPCGRYAMVYNGEIYNFKEIKKELGDYWQWRTHSDSEVLLAAWIRWGEDCLKRFVGMFAFAIHDSDTQKIKLVRDRFGIKPLYYARDEDQWAFASEIQPLLRTLKERCANESTIRTYLETGLYTHSKDTFFENIYAVDPGTLVSINLNTGKWQQHHWYSLAEHIPDLSEATLEELEIEADKRIEEAISSHLVADVDVGLNVSGGVDSSMLTRVTIDTLDEAHLFNQDYDGYSELPWVREVAEGGILHVASLRSEDIEDWLMPTVRSQGEPFGGVFVCGYNALYDLAQKNGVTVLLDGNGVDEIFLGYKRYHQLYVHAANDQKEHQRRLAEFEGFWGDTAKPPAAGRAIDGTSGLRPQAMSDHLKSEVSLLPSIDVQGFDDPVRHAAAEDLLHSKIPRGLRFNDRVSMAHSRELRVPYLDHRLVEYAFGIPEEKLFTPRGTKSIFRDSLARKANSNVAYAVKRSVQSSQREWLANEWRPTVESVLSSNSFRDRGWFDVDKTKKAYQAYLDGDSDNSFFIWQWLNLEWWFREFLDKGVET